MSAGSREPLAEVAAIASGFLDGVNVASIALMATVTAQLARGAIVDAPTAVLALAAAAAANAAAPLTLASVAS